MTAGIPVLTPLADALEDLLVRRFRRQYAAAIRAVTALSGVLVAVSALLLFTDQAGLDAGDYGPILEVTGVVVSLFVVLGVVQFVLLARAVDRTAEEVTKAADEMETGAEEVVEAATEVEAGAQEVESAAEEVETAAQDVESVAEDVESAAEETGASAETPKEAKATGEAAEEKAEHARDAGEHAEEKAEHARETGEKAKDVASEAKDRLGPARADDDGEGDAA
jgi:ABC-type multidrug transport system fused ATPase/permease subunit